MDEGITINEIVNMTDVNRLRDIRNRHMNEYVRLESESRIYTSGFMPINADARILLETVDRHKNIMSLADQRLGQLTGSRIIERGSRKGVHPVNFDERLWKKIKSRL